MAKKPSLPAAVDPDRARDGRWAPGRSGNPAGRPKGSPNFKTLFLELPDDEQEARAEVALTLGITVERVPTGPDSRQLIIWMRRRQARRGNEAAIGDVLDRTDPKPRRHEHSGPEGGPLRSIIGTAGIGSDAAAEYYADRDRLQEGDDE